MVVNVIFEDCMCTWTLTTVSPILDIRVYLRVLGEVA